MTQSINSIIVQTLEPVTGLPVSENFFGDGDDEYICYQIQDDRAEVFADNDPQEIVIRVTVHLFVKRSTNYLRLKKLIRQALLAEDFTWPTVTTLEDGDGWHLIFETEATNNYDID